MRKKHPYFGKCMSTNYQGSQLTMGFAAFSLTMGNRWENPCISHMMRLVDFFLCKLVFVYMLTYVNCRQRSSQLKIK